MATTQPIMDPCSRCRMLPCMCAAPWVWPSITPARTDDDHLVMHIDEPPMTCGFVKDVLDHLRDKYAIAESDYDYAYWMLTSQTKRLRRALRRALGEEVE